MMIVGYSSGGHLAMSISLMKKLRLRMQKQILVSPVVDCSDTAQLDKHDLQVKPDFVEWSLRLYGAGAARGSSLMHYRVESLRPTDIFCGDTDVVRTQTEALNAKLRVAGVPGDFFIASGGHGVFWNNPKLYQQIATRIKTTLALHTLPRQLHKIQEPVWVLQFILCWLLCNVRSFVGDACCGVFQLQSGDS
eukprot:2862230-Amphidinium_carterae.2